MLAAGLLDVLPCFLSHCCVLGLVGILFGIVITSLGKRELLILLLLVYNACAFRPSLYIVLLRVIDKLCYVTVSLP